MESIAKLTSAVYKLLEYFPESDPLKNKAKEKALEIITNLSMVFTDGGWVSLKDYFSGNREKAKLKVLEDIGALLNYFRVAKGQGWINSMNFLIISNEYEKIKKQIGPVSIVKSMEILNDSPQKEIKNSDSDYKITSRQNKIINFLERNQKGQVADLMTVLPNITKRTVRRDLDELLKMGKIAREGEFNNVFYRIKT